MTHRSSLLLLGILSSVALHAAPLRHAEDPEQGTVALASAALAVGGLWLALRRRRRAAGLKFWLRLSILVLFAALVALMVLAFAGTAMPLWLGLLGVASLLAVGVLVVLWRRERRSPY